MKTEIKLYRLAQKIDRYNQDKDGCYWGHILDIITKAYELGLNQKSKEKERTTQEIEIEAEEERRFMYNN